MCVQCLATQLVTFKDGTRLKADVEGRGHEAAIYNILFKEGRYSYHFIGGDTKANIAKVFMGLRVTADTNEESGTNYTKSDDQVGIVAVIVNGDECPTYLFTKSRRKAHSLLLELNNHFMLKQGFDPYQLLLDTEAKMARNKEGEDLSEDFEKLIERGEALIENFKDITGGERDEKRKKESEEPTTEEKLNEVLAKIANHGIASLSKEEKEFLDAQSGK